MILFVFCLLLLPCHFCSHQSCEDDPNPQPVSESIAFFSKLSQTFTLLNHGESTEPASTEGLPKQALIPFEFPSLPSYGPITSRRIAKLMGCDYQRIQCVLVRTIYRLLQFHIQGMFNLKNYKFAAPNPYAYTGAGWSRNPDLWFRALMTAFFPHANLTYVQFSNSVKIKNIEFGQFGVVREDGPSMEYVSLHQTSMLPLRASTSSSGIHSSR